MIAQFKKMLRLAFWTILAAGITQLAHGQDPTAWIGFIFLGQVYLRLHFHGREP